MRPYLGVLAAALVAPALPLLVAAPAQAAGTICVGPVPAGTSCSSTQPTISAAILNAGAPPTLIRVGPGAYTDGPYDLPAGVSLQGNGAGTSASATVLSLPAGAQTYVTARQGSTVADLRVQMVAGNGATGVDARNGSVLDNLVVFAAGSQSSSGIKAQGAQVRDATVNMTHSPTGTGVLSEGGNLLVSQSTWNGGGAGYLLRAPTDNATDTVRQVTVNGDGVAVSVERGVLDIDNSVLDLGGTGTTGLQARPHGDNVQATVHASNLTIVRGAAGARGVVADASGAGTRTASVTLSNSIVWGPTTSLVRDPGAGASAATLAVNNSDYQTKGPGVPDGSANLVAADPRFIDPAAGDYHLRADSPVVDKGVASAGGLDRDNLGRYFDGDRNGIATADMGAYELRDVTAPTTTFTGGPQGPTNNRQPVFTFRSEDGARFECALDGGGYQACSSPATTPPLADGPHQLTVRAVDDVFNVESPPATRAFTVDTAAPNATITKKPRKRFYKRRVKFKFASSEPGTTLQCRLDRRSWRTCRPTLRFNVKVGKHRLLVRAVDAAGNVDPTPARYKYRRLKRR